MYIHIAQMHMSKETNNQTNNQTNKDILKCVAYGSGEAIVVAYTGMADVVLKAMASGKMSTGRTDTSLPSQ